MVRRRNNVRVVRSSDRTFVPLVLLLMRGSPHSLMIHVAGDTTASDIQKYTPIQYTRRIADTVNYKKGSAILDSYICEACQLSCKRKPHAELKQHMCFLHEIPGAKQRVNAI